MVITWALLDTGQWDDALEYAGRARALTALYHEPVVRASVVTAAAYIAACRGHSAAASEDAMSVLGISGLTARSTMTARANHAMGMAALVQNRNDEAFDWLRQLAAGDGRAAHYREALFGLIDLAEAGRRTGRQPEASRLVAGVLAGTQGELSARLLQVRALCRALLADGSAAEEHFLTALSVTEGDHVPFERARVRLSYGQWLRRERRHKDARPHLNAAAHVFRLLAATPWLEAAIHEQRAAGEEPAPHRRMGWRACHPRNGKSSCSRPEVSLILKSPRGCSSPRERSAPICTGLLPSSAYPIARSSPPSPQPCRA